MLHLRVLAQERRSLLQIERPETEDKGCERTEAREEEGDGRDESKKEAAGALSALVINNEPNMDQVAEALVRMLANDRSHSQKVSAQAQEDVEAATARVAKMEAALALAAQAQQELAQQAEAEAGAD